MFPFRQVVDLLQPRKELVLLFFLITVVQDFQGIEMGLGIFCARDPGGRDDGFGKLGHQLAEGVGRHGDIAL